MKDEQVITVEQLISDLEAASSRNDVEAIVALFAPDANDRELPGLACLQPDGGCVPGAG